MIILGIDPGLATVGIGVLEVTSEHPRVLDFCTIETKAGLPVPDRLREIAEDLSGVIKKYHPELAVIERLFFETNRKTAMDVAQARGVILFSLATKGISILEPTPLALKVAVTGDGRADKRQIRDMLQLRLKIDLEGVSDDAVDALGLALYGTLVSDAGVSVLNVR